MSSDTNTSSPNLRTRIGGLTLQNPVMTASGTFGYGLEFRSLLNLHRLGGIVVKGTTLQPRAGNAAPRMAETAQGMLNCVGLQNKGAQHFKDVIYPELRDFFRLETPAAEEHEPAIIVNVSGSSPEDYARCAEEIAELAGIRAIELNISCPNVHDGGMAFGTSAAAAASVVKAVRKAFPRTLIVKLSPNVTDVTEIARACEAEGADALSLINTLMGTSVDIERRQFRLSIGTGGLSGPAVKPVALRMVYQTARAVQIPIIGLGGISSPTDAIEFLMCGARAIEIGTANFIDPAISEKVVDGISDWLREHGIDDVADIIGVL